MTPTQRRSPARRAAEAFAALHARAPVGVWSAPGRVNLIGEHTDYNDGFVLPFALPHRIAVAAAPRGDGMLSVATIGDDGEPQRAAPVPVAELAPGRVSGWAAYPAGVAWVLREHGITGGAELVVVGDLPSGAGLSSSHALQCAVALALLGLAGRTVGDPPAGGRAGGEPSAGGRAAGEPDGAPSRLDVARWVQCSENNFVGAPTGLLDQTASLC